MELCHVFLQYFMSCHFKYLVYKIYMKYEMWEMEIRRKLFAKYLTPSLSHHHIQNLP